MKALPRQFRVSGITTPWNNKPEGKVIYSLVGLESDGADTPDDLPGGGLTSHLSLVMGGAQAQRFPSVGSVVTVDIRVNEG